MDIKHLRIKLIFEPSDHLKSEMINDGFQFLIGKKIKAFGKGSQSLYHKADEKEFEISDVEIGYVDDEASFFSLNIFLKDYNANTEYLYTDEKFENGIGKLLPGFNVSYSESGMQGDDFVNFDVTF